MGAKKKGKGSKLARMSEEERLRYLQHRAAVEEEARRRKEQLIATFMKDKLKREEAFSRLNVAKINQQWRQTLRSYKCIELRQDIEGLHKWFVHAASKKTKQMDVLLEDMDEAATQYSRIQHCHMETVDKLLDIHQQRIDFFRRQFEEDKREIYEKATKEMEGIVSSCLFDEDHLKAILFRMEEEQEKAVKSMEARQTIKADELRNNMLTELENLVLSREARIEELWQRIQAVLKEYWEGTEDRRRLYVTLRDADLENCKQIFFYHQQISNTDDIIIGLKEQLVRTRINSEERFAEVKREKESYCKLFKELRNQVESDREKDRRNLTMLSAAAEEATKELKRIEGKGEQILHILSLCKKLEEFRDEFRPHATDKTFLSEEQEKIVEEECSRHQESLAEEVVSIFSKLSNFWKRFNQVLIEKESLVLTVKSLELEQKELKNALRSYISEMMLAKPSSKIRLTVHRPFTSHVRRQPVLAARKPFSTVPCMEANDSPSIRHMIRVESGK